MSQWKDLSRKFAERAARSKLVISLKAVFEKMPKAARWALLGVLILLLAGGAYAIVHASRNSTVEQSADAAMQTATARRSSIVITATGSGTLIVRDDASAGFSANGTITQVNVKVGDVVEKGQVLAEMKSASAESAYATARLNYLNMVSPAAIANAEKSIQSAQTSRENARNSLAYIISPTVLYWQEQVEAAQAALAIAETQAVLDPSEENQKQVESTQTALKTANDGLTWAWGYYTATYVPETFTVTETDPRTGEETIVYVTNSDGETVPEIEAPSQATIDAAESAYDLAKANLQEAKYYLAALKGEEIPEDATGSSLAQLLNTRASYENAKTQLEGTRLIAPFAGTIMSFNGKVGDEVGSEAIVKISDLSQPYKLEAYFDESDWSNIQTGYEVEVIFDLLPDNTYIGKVVEVTPGLVSGGGSGLVHCYVELTDIVPGSLPSGTAATVEVIAGRATNVITVPMEAVRAIADGQYAVFVVEDGKPKLRLVEVGLMDITTAEIISGLEEGEVVSTGIVETQP